MFRAHLRLAFLALGLLLVISALDARPPTPRATANVIGVLKFDERLEFLPGTMIQVVLRNDSLEPPADAIGEQMIRTPRKAPVPFKVPYDPTRILSDHFYVIHARVFTPRAGLYASVPDVPVITQGNPADGVIVKMRPVSRR